MKRAVYRRTLVEARASEDGHPVLLVVTEERNTHLAWRLSESDGYVPIAYGSARSDLVEFAVLVPATVAAELARSGKLLDPGEVQELVRSERRASALVGLKDQGEAPRG